MRRREFITGLGAAAWPLTARAQQRDRMRTIGVLSNNSEGAAFPEELQRRGWVEGRNVHIEYRRNAGIADRARTFAAELVLLIQTH